jgi:hypothetical protein
MKFIATVFTLVLSLNVFAGAPQDVPVSVPYPSQQQRFYGTIRSVESQIHSELMQKAIEVCKSKENISAIADVEVSFSFQIIEEKKTIFEGGYPLASASAKVSCIQ